MLDGELLIIAVQKHPCLWYSRASETQSHKRGRKELAWEMVAKELYVDWDKETDHEAKILEIKKRWNNVRDYYRKELQSSNFYGSSSKKKKQYVYADILQFLDPILKRENSCNVPEMNFYSQDSTSENTDSSAIEEDAREPTEECMNTDAMMNVSCVHNEDVKPSLASMLKIVESSTQPNDQNEGDVYFLLSFVPEMNNMSQFQKLSFKMGMMELLKNVKFPHGDN